MCGYGYKGGLIDNARPREETTNDSCWCRHLDPDVDVDEMK